MTAVLVDTNVLVDILTENQAWFDWSAAALEDAADVGRLVINPVIYAEISAKIARIEDVNDALPRDRFDYEDIPYPAAFLAGRAFDTYRRRGGTRHAPPPDFFIGAHAAVGGYRLLTRYAARYASYFPGVKLIAP